MYFDKVSFRPNRSESDYLQELAERYGVDSVSDLMHRFLGDCIAWGVTDYGRHENSRPAFRQKGEIRLRDNVGVYRGDNLCRHEDKLSTNAGGDIQATIQRQQMQIVMLQQMQYHMWQRGIVMQQQIEYMSRQLEASIYVPPTPVPYYGFQMPAYSVPRRESHDLMDMMSNDFDKAMKIRNLMKNW